MRVGDDSALEDSDGDGLTRPSLSPRSRKTSSKTHRKRSDTAWTDTMKACIPDFMPIDEGGRYIQVILADQNVHVSEVSALFAAICHLQSAQAPTRELLVR